MKSKMVLLMENIDRNFWIYLTLLGGIVFIVGGIFNLSNITQTPPHSMSVNNTASNNLKFLVSPQLPIGYTTNTMTSGTFPFTTTTVSPYSSKSLK